MGRGGTKATLMSDRRLIIMIGALLGGCGRLGDADKPGARRVERDTVGDTILVRNYGGGAWGDTLSVAEEARIGKPGDPDEATINSVESTEIDSANNVYVFDGKVGLLRKFDAAGRYLRTIGRSGAGRGEY